MGRAEGVLLGKRANAAVRLNYSVYCLDVLGDQSTTRSFFMYSSRSCQCAGI